MRERRGLIVLDARTLIHALSAAAVLDRHGIDHDDDGEVRLSECPACGHRTSRGTLSVCIDTGSWRCYRCGDRGGPYHLLARLEGLDPERDRAKLLELVTEIVGDAADPASRARVAKQAARTAEARSRRAERRAAALADMPRRWESCVRRHAGGEAYLRDERGVDPSRLIDVVRYCDTRAGEPALPLRDLEIGVVTGIQWRRTMPGEPRIMGEPDSRATGSALYGRPADLDGEGVDVAVIVEGLMDTLVATLAWPGCAIYGAPGAEHLPTIARAIAPRIAACRGWLLLVPHDDDAGAEHAAEAIAEARRYGLTLAPEDAGLHGASTIRLVDLGEHNDLADAWRSGWRHLWPRSRRTS